MINGCQIIAKKVKNRANPSGTFREKIEKYPKRGCFFRRNMVK